MAGRQGVSLIAFVRVPPFTFVSQLFQILLVRQSTSCHRPSSVGRCLRTLPAQCHSECHSPQASSELDASENLREILLLTLRRLWHGASSSRRAVRGTRARRERRGEEGASAQDDPRTAKSRLSRRTSPGPIEQPGMSGRDFRPWLISAA